MKGLRRGSTPRSSLKTITVLTLFVNIIYAVGIIPALKTMLAEITLLTLTFLAGATVKSLPPLSKRAFKKRSAPTLDDLVSYLLVRRSVPSTLLRIFLWNLSITLLLILVGLVTFGVFPLVWTFITLGLAAPSLSSFREHLHLWFEVSAFLLSASLGLWGGLRISNLQTGLDLVPLPLIGFIIVLQFSASMLEALETSSEESQKI
ncbi:hypothetical protein B6U84_04575 [Candidatus Bathyarchaeota archaeon ex4484_40]|nr:MAG: hypothetical protein B6U84_04575 [Candidatus Bathyarchaeota archaeon ex4484_40]